MSLIPARPRRTRRRALLLVLILGISMLGAMVPAAAEATPIQGDKCIEYYFEYTDGHVDRDEICASTGTPAKMNLTKSVHGIHVTRLHISCSDLYSVPVYEGDTLIGYDTDGISDLDGHLIAVEDGKGQWGVAKNWTGDPVDCGFIPPPPPPVCEGGVMVEVRDADTGAIVSGAQGTFTGGAIDLSDGTADAGTFDCGTEHTATLTSAPAGYDIVTGSDTDTLSETDGDTITLVLTVGSTDVLDDDRVCEGQLEVVVVGPSGEPVDGPVMVDGTPISTPYSTGEAHCDDYTVVLDTDDLPDGVTLTDVTNSDTDGPDAGGSQSVTIEDGDTDRVVFVLGVAPGTGDEVDAAPIDEVDAAGEAEVEARVLAESEELPRTGAGRSTSLLLLSLLLLAGGVGALRLSGPAPRR